MDTNENSAAPKIVVGVALAAVFGSAFYFYGVRNTTDTTVAKVPAPIAAPPAADANTPAPTDPAAAPTPTDPATAATTATPSPATPPTPSVAQGDTTTAPVVSGESADTTTPVKPKKSFDKHLAKRDSSDSDSHSDSATGHRNLTASTDTASSASNANARRDAADTPAAAPSPAAPAEVTTPPADAPVARDAAPLQPPAGSTEAAGTENPPATPLPGASDSKISADVKSQIASAAPASNVNVTTTNGNVALQGSVPSEDVANQAKQAAQRVEGVKSVDASGLLVSNQ